MGFISHDLHFYMFVVTFVCAFIGGALMLSAYNIPKYPPFESNKKYKINECMTTLSCIYPECMQYFNNTIHDCIDNKCKYYDDTLSYSYEKLHSCIEKYFCTIETNVLSCMSDYKTFKYNYYHDMTFAVLFTLACIFFGVPILSLITLFINSCMMNM